MIPHYLAHDLYGLLIAAQFALLLANERRSCMPGFLAASGYEGTERIDLGNGYWCDVKKCLTSAESGRAEAVMIGNHRLGNSGQSADVNSRGYRTEMVVLSLVDWNLDDEDGNKWPLDGNEVNGRTVYSPGCLRRQSVARLPEPVFETIFKRVDDLNSPRKGTEAASFPDQDERGDQDGDRTAPGAGQVPDGTPVLEGTGA